VSSASASTEILTLDGHGLTTNDPVTFRAESGGSLPTGLSAGTTYYAIRLTDSTFQVSATVDGSAVNLTTAGSNIFLVRSIPWATAISWASALVDDMVRGHATPISTPYPQLVVEVAAELASDWLRTWCGVRSVQLADRIVWAQGVLDRWVKTQPIHGTNAPASGNTAVRASTTATDVRGWVRDGEQGNIP
jgi:hypothetical protein